MKRKFIAPNYNCVVQDSSGHRHEWISYAATENELRERLEAQGLTVLSVEQFDFSSWQQEAQDHLARFEDTRAQTGEYNFTPRLWQKLKQHLFELFGGKCAYCDTAVLHVASGDVEHYRPKRKVEEKDDHPGYYWLAYSPDNLLPCCEKCNRARGKKNHFPVTGAYWMAKDSVNQENPLLFNPYIHDPFEHFSHTLDPRGLNLDVVRGISDIGERSREVYNLNRTELMLYRNKERNGFLTELLMHASQRNEQAINRIIESAKSGEREFHVMCLNAISSWIEEEERRLQKRREILGRSEIEDDATTIY